MFSKVTFKTLHKMQATSLVFCLVTLFAAGAWAQDIDKPISDAEVFRPEKRNTKVELVDSTKSNSVTLNVDIFADGMVGSYYILWDEVDLSEDIKKLMTTRDFARDEFLCRISTASSSSRNACCSSSKTRKRNTSPSSPKKRSR